MSTYFIDFQGFYNENTMIIKELCVIDANNIFNPYHQVFNLGISPSILAEKTQFTNKYLSNYYHYLKWEEGTSLFCPTCILNKFDDTNALFFVLDKVDGIKINTLKNYFPSWRLVNYNKTMIDLPQTPSNIKCPLREHGQQCAYKQSLSMAIDYCTTFLL